MFLCKTRRALSALLVLLLVLAVPVQAAGTIHEQLDAMIANEFPEGYVWNDSFGGGIQCYGFAMMVTNRLFGYNSAGEIRRWTYGGESDSGMVTLGKLTPGNYDAASMKALMAKAQPGCVIQRDRSSIGEYQHSMIFLSAGVNSFIIYDCNSHLDNVVHIREIGYGDWSKKTFASVSLLMADNYPAGEKPLPPAPTYPPTSESDILNRISKLMSSDYPVGSKYNGVKSDLPSLDFACEVVNTIFGPLGGKERSFNTSGTSLTGMSLVGRLVYEQYEAKNIELLFKNAHIGDVITLDVGTNDTAHCMVFLSADGEGIWVYDADRNGDLVVKKRYLQYATRFHNGTWSSISLLRAEDYPNLPPVDGVITIPIEPVIPPKPVDPTSPVVPPKPATFVDVPHDFWAYSYITSLAERRIVRGRDDTHYAPNDTVTRAEFVTMLARLANANPKAKAGLFKDVSVSDWYSNAVTWAASKNIARGDKNGYFRPTAPITREDMAVMIKRFSESQGMKITGIQTDKFFDRGAISSYARDAVDLLASAGIISGKRDGYFVPKDSATRAETAKVLYNITK
ncbi:MAG: S-layer homology domain-containing protein [Clostridia bacterium]